VSGSLWRCPTCGADLTVEAGILCRACGKSVLVDGRLLDFRPLTPQLNLGLAPLMHHLHDTRGGMYRDDTKSPRVLHALRRIAEYADKGVCLEIGAANGPMTPELEDRFDQVIALDHSSSMLKHTLRKTRSAVCVVGDMHFLPLRNESVDFVVLTEVLEHAVVPTQLLLEIRRVLKREGRAFLTVPNERRMGFLIRGNVKAPISTHVNFFDTVSLRRLLLLCGFTIVDVRTWGPRQPLGKVLLDPWRLRRHLPALGKFVECVVQPGAAPGASWDAT